MKKSQNLRQVGYSMILVSASLVAILVIGVVIGEMFYLQTICLETAQLISMSVKKMISKQMDVRYTGIELTIKFQEYT